MKRYSALLLALLFLPAPLAGADTKTATVKSPNGTIEVTVSLKEKLEPYPQGERLYYSVSYNSKEILLDSPLGLDFKDMPPLARDLTIRDHAAKSIDETWETVLGKSNRVTNRCNELRVALEETNNRHRKFDLLVRAYDDGVALRYFLPEQAPAKDFRLTSERTEFHFAGNHTIWAAQYGGYVSHQESEFEKMTLSQINSASVVGLPLLVQLADDYWGALTEANLTDWAGMYLAGAGNCPNALVTTLSPRPDEPGVLVRSTFPRYTPWRVLMLGKRPGDLIESNLVLNLSEPCALQDTSWIQPGICVWDRWWSGDYAPDANFKIGMNTATMKYFTQFAADMKFPYVLVDWWWYGNPEDPNSDITKPTADLDMPELLRFAKERNVKVVVWLRWNHAEKQMDEAFPLYEKWGVSGVKVDFMQRDDQEMVNFYERLTKKAAEHKLLVDFHGAYKPTGIRRTYPNLVTREGVLGNEYNKWSTRVTPDHTVTLPFTRMLVGPMDFTPVGFRNVGKADFKPQDTAPFVMGTRSHQLAMMVVYESPVQVLADSPYNYRGQAGLDFLSLVPTSWDETRVLDGQVGDYIVMARRAGNRWFIGGMTDWDPRTLTVPLSFLGPGKYLARIFRDAPDSADFPTHVADETRTVTNQDSLAIVMAPGGGSAICLTPEN